MGNEDVKERKRWKGSVKRETLCLCESEKERERERESERLARFHISNIHTYTCIYEYN